MRVEVLDVSDLGWEERLAASAFQGLVNRAAGADPDAVLLFLVYGSYDDPSTRRTNSVMMTEEDWFGRYRRYLANNDRDNLDCYRKAYPGLETEEFAGMEGLTALVLRHRELLRGAVLWDPGFPDTANLALVYAGLEDLLVVAPGLAAWAGKLGIAIAQDLRGRFGDRVELYAWAFENLRPRCAERELAANEPGWERPEFADYIVKNRLFAFGLSSYEKGGARKRGEDILLLLAAGPWHLRNALFTLRLDAPLRRLALGLLSNGRETRLLLRILSSIGATGRASRSASRSASRYASQGAKGGPGGSPYPTLFGWHVDRDDELSFMLLVSASGARLVPAFLAGNYSFHSGLPAPEGVAFEQPHADPATVELEEDKVYLTFTLSDGDQLALMNTAELGGFRRPERGSVPFNWEIQPLLAEIAPALLGLYYSGLGPSDLLVAGPSGAGYVMPPLVPDLEEYFRESGRVCSKAGIKVATSYNGDPPRRVLRGHAAAEGIIGFISGYFHLGRRPAYMTGGKPFVAYAWPHAKDIGASRDDTLAGIKALVEEAGPTPRFVACHLFAYRTSVTDVAAFVEGLDASRVKVVRGDEFLAAAAHWMEKR